MDWQRLNQTFKSAVFPRFCASCKAEGTLLCAPCATAWQPRPVCYSSLLCSFQYADPVARELIQAWKYSYDQTAWQHLQRKLGPAIHMLHELAVEQALEAVVPVPLHRQRKLERGFDQAEMMARFLSNLVDIPMKPLLMRARTTSSQTDREPSDRVQAMKDNPFSLQDLEAPIPERVLLVDDVWTTGATALAAEDVLRNAGVEMAWFYTLAKGG